MPDQLFFNSNVGVVSCIMVFTTHKPHPKNKETFFGYFKDDGFVKRKTQGRIDAYGKWANIKEEWLLYYLNRKSKPGFSINRCVSAEDEWCAEAYMETDYSQITESVLEQSSLNYFAFLVTNRLTQTVLKNYE